MSFNLLTLRHPHSFARLLARKAWRRITDRRVFARRAGGFRPPADPDAIDVRELIASVPVEEHLARADRYFSTIEDWSWHLAKPFGSPQDAPQLLMNFGAVLQGMQLAPGMRVLDFGAGTGWTSHWLTQMGCEVVCCDVSPAALNIARKLYESHPPFGNTPTAEFLRFDGRHFDLPDASVDRILCFDAFHHAPNPDEVLAEMSRILRNGGIAAFSEPGPFHSRTPQSQSEMRQHGVIENDVDIRAIDRRAREVGFGSMTLAASYFAPHHVTLEGHENLLAGGEEFVRWAEAGRSSMNDARMFFLVKGDGIRRDSRQTRGLAGALRLLGSDTSSPAEGLRFEVEVINSGEVEWLASGTSPGGVALGAHLSAADGSERIHDWVWTDLSADRRVVAPGERLEVRVSTPPLRPGRWIIELGLVSDRVAWFEQLGSENVRITVDVG